MDVRALQRAVAGIDVATKSIWKNGGKLSGSSVGGQKIATSLQASADSVARGISKSLPQQDAQQGQRILTEFGQKHFKAGFDAAADRYVTRGLHSDFDLLPGELPSGISPRTRFPDLPHGASTAEHRALKASLGELQKLSFQAGYTKLVSESVPNSSTTHIDYATAAKQLDDIAIAMRKRASL